jgi:hypothetical protein
MELEEGGGGCCYTLLLLELPELLVLIKFVPVIYGETRPPRRRWKKEINVGSWMEEPFFLWQAFSIIIIL